MKARDVMSSPVVTIGADAQATEAASVLVAHGFAAAPVVDGAGHVIGIVSEADLIQNRIAPDGWVAEESLESPVRDLMTPTPTSMRPDDDLADVVGLMLDGNYRSVPILDDGRLVGIVSRRDVLRAVAERLLTSEDVWRARVGMASHDRAN